MYTVGSYLAARLPQIGLTVQQALANREGPTLIECALERDDCSADLISFGRRVATANPRPPQN